MGTEEQTIITPAVRAAQKPAVGRGRPAGRRRAVYYVLQGRVRCGGGRCTTTSRIGAAQDDRFETGVNWTLGLPSSAPVRPPAPGYDIAGRGKANPSRMVAALRLARHWPATDKPAPPSETAARGCRAAAPPPRRRSAGSPILAKKGAGWDEARPARALSAS